MFFQKLKSPKLPKFKGNKPYIVPTLYGILFLSMIVLIFAMGYYRTNAPFHTVGLTLIVFGLVSMIQTNSNLQDLAIAVEYCELGSAGETTELQLSLRNTAALPSYNLLIQPDKLFATKDPLKINELSAQTQFRLKLVCPTRGVYPLGRIKVYSRGVYGLFYTWRWQDTDAELIVYPTPRGNLPLPGGSEGAAKRSMYSEDFVGHRPFVLGDSLKHIDWKAYARGSELLLKDFADEAMEALDLRWDDTRGDVEERLEQLSAWVTLMSRNQRPYSLQMPAGLVPRGLGSEHDMLALRALAAHEELAA